MELGLSRVPVKGSCTDHQLLYHPRALLVLPLHLPHHHHHHHHPCCRYIVKQLTRSERQSFLEFAPDYFRYVAATTATATSAQQQQQQQELGEDESEGGGQAGSCLTKILGVFQVRRLKAVV